MNGDKSVEIICSACGADTLLIRKPQYEGFTKVGEILSCTSCGHVFASEQEVPFKGKQTVTIFTDADKSAKVEVFHEDEKGRICRYCENYLVNPFTQWCSLQKKEVEATDSCDRFKKKPEPPPPKI